MTKVEDLDGKRIATSYPGIVQPYLADRGVTAEVVRLDGAVESSIRLGVADAIADVVETGSTLRQADLEVFGDPILSSEAVLITHDDGEGTMPAGYEIFKRRLDGVLVARTYVMMEYDIPVEHVERAVELTPGIDSPTISPLRREGWVEVRSMVPRDGAQKIMDRLFEVGARGILVTDILACRL
jgi:ATP phosphoribosyltransferase